MKQFLFLIYKRFLTWVGDLYFATEPPKVRWLNVEQLLEKAEVGDIVCRGYDSYVDGYFIPGEFSHSGLVVGKNEVTHAVAEGVSNVSLGDFVIDTDRFILLRPDYKFGKGVQKAIDQAIWYRVNKTEYDFMFREGLNEVYCHEFTASCLNEAGVVVPRIEKEFGVWPFKFVKKIYLADSFIPVSNEIYRF